MFSISLYKIVLLLIAIITIISMIRLYEGFGTKLFSNTMMNFPTKFMNNRETHLNSIKIPSGLRNAYLSGGGDPLFRVPNRIRQKEQPLQKVNCNYPIKNEEMKKHPFF